jgi:sulfoxide reductase heme-binding subunit YedZ
MDLDPHVWWYMTRASAIVAFALVGLTTGLGLVVTSRLGDGILGRPWVFEVHKFTSLLALAFIGLHLAVLIPDPWTDFEPMDLLLPGPSPYRPLAVAIGVLAMYGAVVAAGSFYIKEHLGRRTWRALHYASFGAFLLALLHGLYAGTDSGEPWMRLTYFVTGMIIFFLIVFRILAAPLPRARPNGNSKALSGGVAANMRAR